MEIISVRSTETRNRFAGLGPGRGVFRVSVGNPADGRESAVESSMCGKIRRRPQGALDDFALQVGHDEMLRLHRLVGNTTRLNDDQAIIAGDAARVAKGRKH